jgi:pimeloyl-ACP methyl ester carboxylesterase
MEPSSRMRPVFPRAWLNARFPIRSGNNPNVRVLQPPRLDWAWMLPPGMLEKLPAESLQHDSTQTTYQLWLPPNFVAQQKLPHALILWISSKPAPDELLVWEPICRKYNAIFATAQFGGDELPPLRRLQQTLDVLDDVRRRFFVDTDRVYIGGHSEGARTACNVAFAYPEFCGGVLAVGAADSLRIEPYLRDRVRERLSVALLTGTLDPARNEIELWRSPALQGHEVRQRVWTVPFLGPVMPPPVVLEEAFLWLEAAQANRRALGMRFPSMRMPEGVVLAADQWSLSLVDEARKRLADPAKRESGILLLLGVKQRWPGTAAAGEAIRLLAEQDRKEPTSEQLFRRSQQRFAYREAECLDQLLATGLGPREQANRPIFLQHAILLWEMVLQNGPDTREGQRAQRRLAQLRRGG